MRKTPVPRNRRLGLVFALHALRGQLRVGVMATVYRALARRSFAASLTIAREDQVARPIPAQKECRCGEWALGPRASGWLAQSCGKHLGHMAARCSLRGSSSSCSARPKRPDKPEYQDCEGRCPTERVRRFSAWCLRWGIWGCGSRQCWHGRCSVRLWCQTAIEVAGAGASTWLLEP